MAEIKQPKIRFKGHINDWEQHKLGKVLDIHSGRDYKHLNIGNIPVYGTGGYMLSVDKALSYEEDAIGIGRKGTIDRPYILKAPFWTVDTLFFAIPRVIYDIEFIYSIFQKINWKAKDESTGVPSLSKTVINSISVNLPSSNEQQKIGAFFKQLDETIALHQQKLEVTKQFKQTMLKKMFPKNGETPPEIRFKGFTDDWEKCKLKDLCSLSTGKLDANAMTSDGKYSFFTSGEKVYKTDTFAFDGDAILIAGNGNVGLQHTYRGKFNAYQRTYVLMDFKINKEILSNQITLELPKVLRRETRVGVIPYIVKDMLTELPISYPRNVKEQTSISEYFNTLNSNIFNIECRLENLLNLKQTMLKKLFI